MAQIPVRSWDQFLARFDWRAGEHVTLIGHTGSGKSHLAGRILATRRYSVVLGTKPRDPTLEWFRRHGWRRIQSWPPPNHVERVLLWPKVREPSDLPDQREAMRDALDAIFVEGAWAIYVDELPYVSGQLGLSDLLELLWLQGRALDLSLAVATQRPANVPLLAYSQATHLFLWRTTDRRDLARLSEIGGTVNREQIQAAAARLPKFAFLYVNTRTGELSISRAPATRDTEVAV